ncbi:hypothetical protein GH714_013264 [Hevea brasiliensis]|uniref:Uncharacterized protein n=1 Tax=Hevea brasiliensis TaxID=3981 RepID=A0A6A6LA00_HEVBR|nr:hypothetical protein GH714_013264 [Hevea brasiliensis]
MLKKKKVDPVIANFKLIEGIMVLDSDTLLRQGIWRKEGDRMAGMSSNRTKSFEVRRIEGGSSSRHEHEEDNEFMDVAWSFTTCSTFYFSTLGNGVD